MFSLLFNSFINHVQFKHCSAVIFLTCIMMSWFYTYLYIQAYLLAYLNRIYYRPFFSICSHQFYMSMPSEAFPDSQARTSVVTTIPPLIRSPFFYQLTQEKEGKMQSINSLFSSYVFQKITLSPVLAAFLASICRLRF